MHKIISVIFSSTYVDMQLKMRAQFRQSQAVDPGSSASGYLKKLKKIILDGAIFRNQELSNFEEKNMKF